MKTAPPDWSAQPADIQTRYRAAAIELWHSDIVTEADREAEQEPDVFKASLHEAIRQSELARKPWPILSERQKRHDEASAAVRVACETIAAYLESEEPLDANRVASALRHSKIEQKHVEQFLHSMSRKTAEADFRDGYEVGPLRLQHLMRDWRVRAPAKPVLLTIALSHSFSAIASGMPLVGPVVKGICWRAAATFTALAIGGDPKAIHQASERAFTRHAATPESEEGLYFVDWQRNPTVER